MPTSAISAHGTLLQLGDGATPENFATIAEVRDISGPSLGADTEDITSHDSGGWREFIATVRKGGEVTCDILYHDHTTHTNLITNMNNGVRRNFKLVFPLTPVKTVSFAAYVTGFEFSAPVDGALTASLTLTITGAVTIT